MPLILPGNVASATASTTYSVANSCRINYPDDPYMQKTPASAGNRDRWTFSCWFKRGILSSVSGVSQYIFTQSKTSSIYALIGFNTSDQIWFQNQNSGDIGLLVTTRKFRDPAAWYHLAVIWDSANGTPADRYQIWINGVRETVFDTNTGVDSGEDSMMNRDDTPMSIGAVAWFGTSWSNEFDGYLAECVFIDGLALDASSFGEFDSDTPSIFKPKDVSGLTFGTNGFYLDFEASDNLGNDANGGTDLTEANLDATDQCQDSPTNNFATLNPLDHYSYATSSTGATLTEGSLKFVIASGNKGFARSTFGVTAGKWYWECKLHAVSKGFLGVCNGDILIDPTPQYNAVYIYENVPDFRSGDQVLTTGVASISTDDIMNFALDMDNHAFYIGVNNTWMNSGDPESGASRTGAISELFTTGRAIISDSGAMFANLLNTSQSGGINTSMNFGCPPYANASDAADADGYGAFEFAPPTGYFALCTKNLAEYG